MKKFLSMILVFTLLSCFSGAMAADTGVQLIPLPSSESEPVSLDDLMLNVEAEIEDWGIFCITSAEWKDRLGYYAAGKDTPGYHGSTYTSKGLYYESGADADYYVLYVDITNTTGNAKNYLSQAEVKVVYEDAREYEFMGWCYQLNHNNRVNDYGESSDARNQNTRWVIDGADQFSIDPMYQGHYLFGCTLPNAVVNSKKPLRMVITIDGNEITYNIRK